MTSKINTSGLDITFPIPGINNSTQGFRDNFTSIKNSLDNAAAEISDIQSKAVLKSGLSGTSLNNDMANAMISNVSLRGVRYATFNMGGSLQTYTQAGDEVVIDVSKGDVQYASINGNTRIIFAGWAPSGTQCSLELQLLLSNTALANTTYLQFPNTLYGLDGKINYGMTDTIRSLENYSSFYTGNGEPVTISANSDFAGLPDTARGIMNRVTFPNGTLVLKYKLTTRDCGTTIDITPLNRPVQTTQIQMKYNADLNSGAGTPSTNDINDGFGRLGDAKGQIATDGSKVYICTDNYVKDGIEAQNIITGTRYNIISLGDTDWSNIVPPELLPETPGLTFTAQANGAPASGVEGMVQPAIWKYIDLNNFGS